MNIDHLAKSLINPPFKGYSDLKQDILALLISDSKRDGFFVEFGGLDGITGSNTYLLEKEYGWNGIVAEAARTWQEKLKTNRKCILDFRAVAGHTGQTLTFKEVDIQLGLSGLVDFFDDKEQHAQRRNASSGNFYKVPTVSLVDLLDQHGAPGYIDYISVDTEGSEPAILSTFDFTKYKVGLWTVEHNHFPPAREEIFKIMTDNGYQRLLPELSSIDDWYVPS